MALSIGLVVLVGWLVAIASGVATYTAFTDVMGSVIGRLATGMTWRKRTTRWAYAQVVKIRLAVELFGSVPLVRRPSAKAESTTISVCRLVCQLSRTGKN